MRSSPMMQVSGERQPILQDWQSAAYCTGGASGAVPIPDDRIKGFDGWARLPNKETASELVAVLDRVLGLSGVIGAAADAGDDRIVRPGLGCARDGAGEDRAYDRLEAARLPGLDRAFRVHG